MSISRAQLRVLGKGIAQDAGPGSSATGVQLLLTEPDDYNLAIAQALAQFAVDRPNVRVVDVDVPADGFRFALNGADSVLPVDPEAPAAPGVTVGGGAGNITNGVHRWGVTAVYDYGETLMGATTAATVADKATNGKATIAISDPDDTVGLQGFNVYRTPATGSVYGLALYVPFVSGASSGVDNLADSGLGAEPPAIATALNPDAWVPGGSGIASVVWPFDATQQGVGANDPNGYGVVRGPGGVFNLEFVSDRPEAGDTIRVEFTRPHTLDESVPANSTILAGDREALVTITAAFILLIAANKSVQNTGNTGLPNDVVDRRSQSDVFRSRSNELMKVYGSLVGKGATADIKAQSGFKDLNTDPTFRRFFGGYLLH